MISITRATAAFAVAAFTAACASLNEMLARDDADAPAAIAATSGGGGTDGTVDLLANGLDGFVELGGADWIYADGVLMATAGSGMGFLLTPDDYRDFELTVEFFVGAEHNSGVFFRCSDRTNITDVNCYEVNIFDNRPDQSGRTGGIPNYAAPLAIVDAAEKWNTYVIRAQGDHIVVTLNGQTTVDTHDATLASGPLALQWGAGAVMFRNVRVKRL